MTAGVFVTGTDTDCGKTVVAVALIEGLRAHGLRAVGCKPVAAGATRVDGELRNDDALALAKASATDLPYDLVNPYCFAPAIAPHIAAAEHGERIRLPRVLDAVDRLAQRHDFIIVEGAGGWRVPLDEQLDIQGLAVALRLPVVLVVGLRLGCLNHAQLSEQAILASGVRLAGWIGSQVDPGMPYVAENVATLRARLTSPCLGVLAHNAAPSTGELARPLDPARILGRLAELETA